MTAKTHQSAIVLVPPRDLWEPIQRIRRDRDRRHRRWMPHVTYLFPFFEAGTEDEWLPRLEAWASRRAPIDSTWDLLGTFVHGSRSVTMWVGPRDTKPFVELQHALVEQLPDCREILDSHGTFRPHITLGQWRGAGGRTEATRFLQELRPSWPPLRFRFTSLAWVTRGTPPDDVFEVWRSIEFGAGSGSSRSRPGS